MIMMEYTVILGASRGYVERISYIAIYIVSECCSGIGFPSSTKSLEIVVAVAIIPTLPRQNTPRFGILMLSAGKKRVKGCRQGTTNHGCTGHNAAALASPGAVAGC
jgi:hypothetical protein